MIEGFIVGLVIAFWLFFMLICLSAFIFWVVMLIDIIQRDFKKHDDKIIWLLVVIFAGIIGAIIYYFIVKRHDKHPPKLKK